MWSTSKILIALVVVLALGSSVVRPAGVAGQTATPTATATATATPSPTGRIVSGSIPFAGFGLIVFGGGTYDQLIAASGCPASRVAFWATQGGAFIVYVPGTTVGAVNAPFESAFPSRTLPVSTALVARCSPVPAIDPRNATYEIDGRPVALVNGLSEVEAAPGSASKVTTRYFGNEATSDLDGDGVPDVGFVVTQSTGGTGTFYYAVVALKTSAGYVGTNAVLLGDRVAPQTTEIRDGLLIVNYADRKPAEPMTAPPSVGVSKYLRLVGGRLAETTMSLASITLPDGTACRHAGAGATLAFQGQRVNYTCGSEGGQETVLLGSFVIGGQQLTVTRGVVGRDASGFVLLSSQPLTFRIERVTLFDSTTCAFAGSGATLAFADKRVNYTCTGPLDVLLGNFTVSGDVVSAERGTVGREGSGFILVASAPASVREIDGR